MTNQLSIGMDWLRSQLQEHAGTPIVYRRGADSVAITATVGMTEYEHDPGTGFIVRFTSRDYIIQASALVFGGVVSLPMSGDLIEETQGHLRHVHEVTEISGAPHYKPRDQFRTMLRIHTKQRRVERIQ